MANLVLGVRDKIIAEISLADGVLKYKGEDPEYAKKLVETLRASGPRGKLDDQELFNSLPRRLSGYVWVQALSR